MFGRSKTPNALPIPQNQKLPGLPPTAAPAPERLAPVHRIEVIEGDGGQTDWALFEAAVREQNNTGGQS